jgi:predicted SnoaL-like aldol condensation-catalyzing enzyme
MYKTQTSISASISRVVVLIVCLAFGANATAQAPAPGPCDTTQDELNANKQLLLDFFASGHLSREERAARFQTEDYIQHNPRLLRLDEITGATGRQSWIQGFEEATRRGISIVDLNGIRLTDPPVILMAECDLVTAIYRGEVQDPDDPQRTYEAFAFETVRVRDGKFSEHWDQVTLQAGWMNSETADASD